MKRTFPLTSGRQLSAEDREKIRAGEIILPLWKWRMRRARTPMWVHRALLHGEPTPGATGMGRIDCPCHAIWWEKRRSDSID